MRSPKEGLSQFMACILKPIYFCQLQEELIIILNLPVAHSRQSRTKLLKKTIMHLFRANTQMGIIIKAVTIRSLHLLR